MDALELINLRYDAVHGGFVDDLFSGLSDEQVRQRPGGVNSIAWLVWHLARVQDAAVSRFVDDRPQVLEEGRWSQAMRLDRRDVGSGMTSEDVDALGAAIDITALRGYHRAVAERTKLIATSLSAGAWNEVVPAEGLLVDAGRWVEEFWARQHSRAWYLLQVGLLHPYGHCFEAMVTRGLLGAPER